MSENKRRKILFENTVSPNNNNHINNSYNSSINIPPDVTIQCKDNKEVKAHLFMLSLFSEVFEKMFYGPFKKENVIELIEYDVAIIEQFLKFIYCYTIDLNEDNYFQILNLSKQFMIKELTIECTNFLLKFIEETNNENKLLLIFQQSLLFEEQELVEKCLTKLEISSASLFNENNNALLELSKEGMKSLLESDELCVKEIDIFTKVLQWIEKNNDENDTDLFNEFKLLIRFPLMSNAELLSTVHDSKKLSEEEFVNVLKYKEFGSKIQSIFNKNPRNSAFTKGIYKEKLQLSILLKQKWNVIYQENYGHITTEYELLKIKSSYDKNRLLCVCGKEKYKDIIELAAIDTIENVLKETSDKYIASKGGAEGLYWYFVGGYSFGFSNESKINLDGSDMTTGKLKLSWRLNAMGGRRVGDKDLTYSADWEKIILIL
ncbi:hypothetical protein ABK040_008701 [Willaertia magna]